MTNTEETLAEVAVEEEVQALNTQTSGRPVHQIADKADIALSEFHERAISEVFCLLLNVVVVLSFSACFPSYVLLYDVTNLLSGIPMFNAVRNRTFPLDVVGSLRNGTGSRHGRTFGLGFRLAQRRGGLLHQPNGKTGSRLV